MANKRIIDLGANGTIVPGTDIIPVYQPAEAGIKTRKVTLEDVAALNDSAITAAQNAANAAQADATQALQDASDAQIAADAAQVDAAAAIASADAATLTANAAAADATTALGTANAAIPASEKGAAGGVATLDGSGKVPASQLTITGTSFLGNWDASTNVPALIDGTGTAGDWYFVINGAGRDLGSGVITWDTGSMIIYDGSVWLENEAVNNITSVNGQTGVVVLNTSHIAEVTDANYVSDNTDAAIAAATGGTPTGSNPFVTNNDPRWANIGSIANVNVISGDMDISFVEDGLNLSGNGTLRYLNTLTNPDTGVAYTNASAAAAFPRTAAKWGSINVGTATYDDVCLQELILQLEGSVALVSARSRRFVVDLPFGHIVVPRATLNGPNRVTFKWQRLGIDGGYSSIKINSAAADKVIFKRQGTSLNDAVNVQPTYLDRGVDYTRWHFVGANATGSKAILDWSSNMLSIEKCEFHNLDYGIELRFALNSEVSKCNFYNTGSYGIYQNIISTAAFPAGWPDATPTGTTSQLVVDKCRMSVKGGSTGVFMRGGDSCSVVNSTIETVVGETGAKGIYYDNAGSTTSKGFSVSNNHFEGNFSDSYIKARVSNNCTVVVDNNYCQGNNNNNFLLNMQVTNGVNYARINNQAVHSGGGLYKYKYAYNGAVTASPGGGGIFEFDGTMLQGNPANSAALLSNPDVFLLTGTDPDTGYAYVSPLSTRLVLNRRPT